MATVEPALKSPSVPLFQRGRFRSWTLTPLWKRGEGEIFGRNGGENYVTNFLGQELFWRGISLALVYPLFHSGLSLDLFSNYPNHYHANRSGAVPSLSGNRARR
jgi:hypothetical protein